MPADSDARRDQTTLTVNAGDEGNTAFEDAGFRRAGRRALTLAERRVVLKRSWWLRAKCAAAVLLFWIVLLVALGTAVFIGEAQGAARLVLILATLLLAGSTVALFLAARSYLSDSRALARDARRGCVQRFSGASPPKAANDSALRTLLQAGLLQPDPTLLQWFEILSHSGFLWQANGARPRRWIPFMPPEPVEVAETPAFAAVAAEWAEPVSNEEAPARVGQRELSEDEIRELRQQVRRALRVRLVWVIPYNLWFWTVVGLGLREGRLPHGSGWTFWHGAASFLLLAVVAILGAVVLVRSVREAWRHARDARIGRVLILRCPVVEEGASEAAPSAWVTMELLPVSEAVWTLDGQPAGWRTGN